MIASALINGVLTAPVIAFLIAMLATFLRFDIRLPDSLYPVLSSFLLLAIGIKGGKALSETSPADMWKPLIASLALGFITPLIAFYLFRLITKFNVINAAALAAHYGSVSAVTFTVLLTSLDSRGMTYESFAAGLLAILEIVGIIVALFLARNATQSGSWKSGLSEVIRGKSITLLVAGLIIGAVVGKERLMPVDPVFVGLFTGALTLFLLELGVVAAERMRDVKEAGIRLVLLGIAIPLCNGFIGAAAGSLAGLSTGGVAIMATLAGSASYIAAPAAVKVALPSASPGIYVTASLGITFPFNLTIGIPTYIGMANLLS
jgi:hypothetical protein